MAEHCARRGAADAGEGDTLVATGDPPTAYVPLGDGRFRLERNEIRFEGGAGNGGVPSRMMIRTPVDTMTFVRADTAVLDAAKLAEYAGDYRSDEAEVTQTWRVEKGQLVMYAGYRRLGIIEPTYKDGFTRGGSVIDGARREGPDCRVRGRVGAGAAPAVHAGAITVRRDLGERFRHGPPAPGRQ